MVRAVPDEPLPLPGVVAHIDWSTSAKKRWVSLATREDTPTSTATWRIHPAMPLTHLLATTEHKDAELHTLEDALLLPARGQGAFIGLDFAIGVPRAPLAAHPEVASFNDLLDLLLDASPPWNNFLEPCETPDQIQPTRPFYPRTPRGARRAHLLDGLNVSEWSALLRACDYAQPGGARPCPLYWTVGANQVGKGAIKGWRELLLPLHARGTLDLWPFDGTLHALLERIRERDKLLIAEVYPAEVYQWLAFDWQQQGKRSQVARKRLAEPLLRALDTTHATLDEETTRQVVDGFGTASSAEDAFDSMVGLAGMLLVLHGEQPLHEPPHATPLRELEGWILGRPRPGRGELPMQEPPE